MTSLYMHYYVTGTHFLVQQKAISRAIGFYFLCFIAFPFYCFVIIAAFGTVIATNIYYNL